MSTAAAAVMGLLSCCFRAARDHTVALHPLLLMLDHAARRRMPTVRRDATAHRAYRDDATRRVISRRVASRCWRPDEPRHATASLAVCVMARRGVSRGVRRFASRRIAVAPR